MPEDPNPELIKKLVEDAYSQYLIEKQAEAKTEAYLNKKHLPTGFDPELVKKVVEHEYSQRLIKEHSEAKAGAFLKQWWAIIGGVAAFLILGFGYLGYSANEAIKNMRTQLEEKAKEVDKKKDEVDKKKEEIEKTSTELSRNLTEAQAHLRQSESELAKVQSFSQIATSLATNSRELLTANQDAAKSTSSIIQSSLTGLLDTQKGLQRTQEGLNAKLGEADERLQAIKTQQENTKKNKEEAESAAIKSKTHADTAELQLGKILNDAGNLSTINAELTKAKALEMVTLRARDTREVILENIHLPSEKGGTAIIERHRIRFRIDGIKDAFNLWSRVCQTTTCETEPEQFFDKLTRYKNAEDPRNEPRAICGTPFVFRVEFIYHAKLAFDFATIKVYPDEKLRNRKAGCPAGNIVLLSPGSIVSPHNVQPLTQVQETYLSPNEKLSLGFKEAFLRPSSYVLPGVGTVWAEARRPKSVGKSLGDNLADGGSRYAINFATRSAKSLFVTGIYPAIFDQHSRYKPSDKEGFAPRFFYAASRVFVTGDRDGNSQFNISRIGGNWTASALANVWERNILGQNRVGFGPTFRRFGVMVGGDMANFVFREFWPDIKKKLRKGQ